MKTLMERFAPVYNTGGDGTGANAGGNNEGAGGGGGWVAPQGLPPEYAGANADEVLGKLFPAFTDINTRFNGMRDKLAQAPKAPESPDLYAFTPSEKLKPYFAEDLSKDPAFAAARKVMHELGVPADKFGTAIENFYQPLIEAGALPKPFNAADEVKNYMEATGLDRTAAAKALTDAEAFAKGLTGQLKLPDAVKEKVGAMLYGLTDYAEGNILLSALSSRLAENGIRVTGEGGQQGMLSAEDLRKLDADPRIDPRNRESPDPNKRFDPDLRKRYDDAYSRLHSSR